MASHHNPGTVVPFSAVIEPHVLERIHDVRPNLFANYAEQLQAEQIDHDSRFADAVLDWIGESILPLGLGAAAGMFATVGLAYVWSWFL